MTPRRIHAAVALKGAPELPRPTSPVQFIVPWVVFDTRRALHFFASESYVTSDSDWMLAARIAFLPF